MRKSSVFLGNFRLNFKSWTHHSDKKEQILCHLQRRGWTWRLSYRVKSGREKQISHINTYMWNLEKWYRWTYLHSRNRDRRKEQAYVGRPGDGVDTYTLLRIRGVTDGDLLCGTGIMLYGDLNGKEIQNRGGLCLRVYVFAVQQKLTQHCKAIPL